MDDLLIVRASDRIRHRRYQRRAQVPLGANLGVVIGAACGLIGMTAFPELSLIGLVGGLGVGIIVGGALGPLLRPKSKRITRFPAKHYDGFPFPEEETESEEEKTS